MIPHMTKDLDRIWQLQTHPYDVNYGNTGCGAGGTKLEIFLYKYQHTQRKFWVLG